MANSPSLRLGITMAGAVSAGAYTAGVMDYLLQTLQRWQTEKDNKNPLAPPHEVKIDVLGGTSAGGISAAITAMTLFDTHQAVVAPDQEPADPNLLFDAWVNLVDDRDQDNSFLKMLDPSDLKPGGGIPSLLNSEFLETISNRALKRFKKGQLPPYVSPDFEVLLTLSNLRGIPMQVNFNSDQEHREHSPNHTMEYHKMYTHFRTEPSSDGDSFLRLDMGEEADRRRLIEFAKATSAFPVGLIPRQITALKTDFVLKTLAKFINPELLAQQLISFQHNLPEDYPFTAVDGGVFNNEPFAEMARLLNWRNLNAAEAPSELAMIMIDPFPSFKEVTNDDKPAETVTEVAGGVVAALRNQASFKEADLLGMAESNMKRNMIYPVRYLGTPQKKANGNEIACGALGGFSGFFSRKFRKHDYFLGRDNCRNFLRYIFSYGYPMTKESVGWDLLKPIHREWSQEMINHFGVESNGKLFLPLIPDFSKLEEGENWKFWYHTERDFPSIPLSSVVGLKAPVERRVREMVNCLMAEPATLPKPPEDDLKDKVRNVVASAYKQGFFARATANLGKYLFAGKIINLVVDQATQFVLKTILTEFVKKELIKKEDLDSLKS